MPKLFGAPSRRVRRDLELVRMQERRKNQSKPRLIKRNAALDTLVNERMKTEKKLGKIQEDSFWIDELMMAGKIYRHKAQGLIESQKALKAKLKKINRKIKRTAMGYSRAEWK